MSPSDYPQGMMRVTEFFDCGLTRIIKNTEIIERTLHDFGHLQDLPAYPLRIDPLAEYLQYGILFHFSAVMSLQSLHLPADLPAFITDIKAVPLLKDLADRIT